MTGLVTYKRWRLRPGVEHAAVRELVRSEIAPHYARLDARVRLGLESVTGTPDVLATQHWPDRETRDRAVGGERFGRWWEDYRSTLGRWDELVELVEEWETEVVPL